MSDDSKHILGEINSSLMRLGKEYPQLMKHFGAFSAVVEGPGALDTKTKELITVALSVKSQCTDCITYHTNEALNAGATKNEIMEAAFVAVLMHGGPAIMQLKKVMKAIDEYKK